MLVSRILVAQDRIDRIKFNNEENEKGRDYMKEIYKAQCNNFVKGSESHEKIPLVCSRKGISSRSNESLALYHL